MCPVGRGVAASKASVSFTCMEWSLSSDMPDPVLRLRDIYGFLTGRPRCLLLLPTYVTGEHREPLAQLDDLLLHVADGLFFDESLGD